MTIMHLRRGLVAVALTSVIASGAVQAAPLLTFTKLWTYDAGGSPLDSYANQGVTDSDLAAEAEIVAYDPASQRLFVVNGREQGVDVLDLAGTKIATLDTSAFGTPNSVAVKNGVVAVAVENGSSRQAAGEVWFFDAATTANTGTVAVGALPDMVTFTPDGSKVLVANEGEPDFYGPGNSDPVGSVSVIDVATRTAAPAIDFGSVVLPAGVRVFGPGATQAQDIEPEYISVSPDGSTAYVTLQENNAVAVIDIAGNSVTRIDALGYKDHGMPGNGLDASDKDGNGPVETWAGLKGMYQPDAIASYTVAGKTYYLTANEGDARDYENAGGIGYTEEERVKNLTGLEGPVAGTDGDNDLGRLNVTTTLGDSDANGDYEELYTFGGRSFSIWDAATGLQVYDSGDLIEKIILDRFPAQWEEGRSDNKGPEPEAITLAGINGWFYALVGLERTNGIMVFDVTDPNNPVFQDYILNAGDVSPEGIVFALLSQDDRGGTGYVAIANEVSGTTSLYEVSAVPVPAGIALLGIGMVAMRRLRGA